MRALSHAHSSLNGSEKLRRKFTNFESCRGKSGEQKLRGCVLLQIDAAVDYGPETLVYVG